MVFRIQRHAMPRGIGQGARELVGIEVEYTDRIAAGDINPAVDAVRRDVVNPSGGRNLSGGKNLVGLGLGVVGRGESDDTQDRQQAEGDRKQSARVLGRCFQEGSPGASGHFVIDRTTF